MMKRLIAALALLAGCTSFPPPQSPSNQELARYTKDVTVQLETDMGSLCSGVWVGRTTAITAFHCVDDLEPGATLDLSVSDGSGAKAHVVATDEAHDLALVGVEDAGEHPIALPGPLPDVGDTVEAMGHPFGLTYSFSTGIVSAIREDERGDKFDVIQSTVATSPGNSGGGLYNASGELVGICSYTIAMRGAQGLNFFIPIRYAANLKPL